MDGLSALKIIKNDPDIRDIPVITLTAHAMRGDELKAKEAGCDGYLSKPIDTKQFFKTLETYMEEEQKKEKTEDENSLKIKEPKWGPTILVVDDEPLNVKLLAANLGAAGYRILKAYSGFEALEIMETNTPDLILLDIMMPGMDGYEVIRRLKQLKETKDIPIVLITALEGEEEKAKGLAAGADEFLNKPVNTTELETRVLSLLRMKKYQEQLVSRVQTEKDVLGKSGQEESGEHDDNRPTVLVVEDNLKDAHMIVHHLNEMPLNYRIVQTGAEALKIVREEAIDLVLLDLMLPDLDGIEICKEIKGSEKTISVQVVIVTTFDDLKMKIRGIEVGADDFLVKPLNRDEIKARVSALLKKKAFMDRLRESANAALKAAIIDHMTGVYNHSYFEHFLLLEIKRSLRQENKMALLMIDVDNFKRFNDTYGHPAGDKALSSVAKILKDNVRDVDVVARYGGEEFAVVLPYAGWRSGQQVAERLLEIIHKQQIAGVGNQVDAASVTVSIGLAVFPDNGMSSESIISSADGALYSAKRQGKNRVCCAEKSQKLISCVKNL
jgi:two-component system cell cycle response regulator